ncbi:MAG: NADH-quinone oxidoreductase subunit L [Acidobacteria bacterium]|nr:NADH-quinone oxidoreductase subunit L [Acidobacteriota bacterium]
MLDYFWLIPLVPLVGVVINGLFASRYIRSQLFTGALASGCMLVAFIIGFGSFMQLASMPVEDRHVEIELYDWISGSLVHMHDNDAHVESATLDIPFGLQFDPLSALMVLVVTGVGFLIHVYAIGYMKHDPPDKGFYRFFTYLNLFASFMLILVLGNSYAMMFIGWEGVGLCSFLLIGYYYKKKSAGDAAKKAFVVNRIGDAAFIIGMFTLFFTFGTLDYDGIFAGAAANSEVGSGLITFATMMLFIGATGKSAQIPLFVWLPDAMEGPTPVSALIHAATMVTAGVYMVVRSNVLFTLSPMTMTVVAVVGALTALMAASIAMVQNDIKRVLAYSTVSQLGYMFLACGVGAYAVGVFHLMTHAFFKALLFMAAGSVMHALHGELDMWKMGNLRKYMPRTHMTFLIGTLAIAGVPGLAGFFSKDEILWYAFTGPNGSPWLWAIGTLVAGMTAFYMMRMLIMVFYGDSRMDEHTESHVHENPPVMTIPLIVLAILSIVGGYVGIPANLRIGPLESLHETVDIVRWLEPVTGGHGAGDDNGEAEAHAMIPDSPAIVAPAIGGEAAQVLARPIAQEPAFVLTAEGEEHNTALEWTLMLISTGVALAGIGLAYQIYGRGKPTDEPAKRFGGLYAALWNKYWVDELYEAAFVQRAKDLGKGLWVFDDAVLDGTVEGVAAATKQSGTASSEFDNRVVDGAVNAAANSVWSGSWIFRALQTGMVQNYALVIAIGAFVLVSAYLFL